MNRGFNKIYYFDNRRKMSCFDKNDRVFIALKTGGFAFSNEELHKPNDHAYMTISFSWNSIFEFLDWGLAVGVDFHFYEAWTQDVARCHTTRSWWSIAITSSIDSRIRYLHPSKKNGFVTWVSRRIVLLKVNLT